MPPDTAQHPSPARRVFGVANGIFTEVFPESPGKEIIVDYAQVYSRRCIRVYDLAGEVLYQTWYDGGIDDLSWLSHPRLLVFAGDDSRVYWKDLGYRELADSKPSVVGAIRPVRGWIATDYFHTEASDGPDSAAWYHYLLPPELMHLGPTIAIAPASPPFDSRYHFSLEVTFSIDEVPAFVWTLDSKGEIVPDGQILNDVYLAHQDELPHPSEFYLGPLPEKVESELEAKSDAPPEAGGQADPVAGE